MLDKDLLLSKLYASIIPERDDFTGKDKGEAERYRLTREAVLKYLLQEPAVLKQFSSLDQATGLLVLAESVAQASEIQKPVVYGKFIERVQALTHLLKTDVAEAAVSWELPYHFLSNGLVNEYILQRAHKALSTPFRTWTDLRKGSLSYKIDIPGDASEVTVEKIFEHIRQACKPDALARGRAPMTNKKNADTAATKGAHLDRNARWLVRHKVGKVPPTNLAHEHYKEQFKNFQNPVSTITKGIKSAQRLLSLTTYVIPSTFTRK